MIANYHTHTWRCNHAWGTEREYVEAAIEGGLQVLGFSDHTPYAFPHGYIGPDKMQPSQLEDYVDTVLRLRDEYRDDIRICLGLEAEYYPELWEGLLRLLEPYPIEYLLLGQHFIHSTETDEGTWTAIVNENPRDLQEYVSCILSGMETGLFTYVAHPDIFRFSGSDELYCREMRKICVASRERNIPLEINLLGIRDNRWYPRSLFWQMAGEEQSPVTFGFDSHDTAAAYDSASLPAAEAMVKKYRLNYIGEPKLVLLQKP